MRPVHSISPRFLRALRVSAFNLLLLSGVYTSVDEVFG